MPHLQIALVRAPDQVVVRLTGEADVSTARRLSAALAEAAVGCRAVVVDVAGVRFRDSSGLETLALFTEALVPAGRRCRLVGAPAATRHLVRSSGLDGRLELDGPVDAAAGVRPPAPRIPAPACRAGLPHQVRAARHAEEWPVRHRSRPGSLRRWR